MFHRRKFLGLLSGFFTIAAFRPLNAATPTPRATEGPFYPIGHAALKDKDNDLVRIKDAVQQAGGQILHLSGTVRDETGNLLKGAKVEIWQCDVNGRYIHESDWSITRSRDEHFQGYGSTQTDENGTYHFRTIKPVPYPGRTPHIHFKIHNPNNGKTLTTQMYVADAPLPLLMPARS